MKVGLAFKTVNLHTIAVKDTTQYKPESGVGKNLKDFKSSETGSIFVLEQHLNSEDSKYIDSIVISEHNTTGVYEIKVPKDGWYTVHHIVLPTKKCIDTFSDQEIEGITYCYYLDGNTVYNRKLKDVEGNPTKVELEVLIESNTNLTTHQVCGKNCIAILNLQNCLVNLCLEIFKNIDGLGKCFKASTKNSDLIFKRDLVWMAINTIKYMGKHNMFAEAARIINQLEGCNGVCTGVSKTQGIQGCGCNN